MKDIIAINRQFDKGVMINESSLVYAVRQANDSKSWLRACAHLVRAVLIDHAFEEGNKRTTAGIIMGYFKDNNINYDNEKVSKAVVNILMNNTTSITKIEKEIANAIIR